MHTKNRNRSGQLIQQRNNKTIEITAGPMGMIQATHTHQIDAQEQWLDTRMRLSDTNQWR